MFILHSFHILSCILSVIILDSDETLQQGAKVWALFGITHYYHGVVSNIQGTTIKVVFDDGDVMHYKNGHLNGNIVIDRKADDHELQEGVNVITKMPINCNKSRNVMYKGVITDVIRRNGLYNVRFENQSQISNYRKRKRSLILVKNYAIKESDPQPKMNNVPLMEQPDATMSMCLLNMTEMDLLSYMSDIDEMEKRSLPAPLSPEKLWLNRQVDLIALQSMVENYGCSNGPSFEQDQAEISVTCFDPLRMHLDYPPRATSTPGENDDLRLDDDV